MTESTGTLREALERLRDKAKGLSDGFGYWEGRYRAYCEALGLLDVHPVTAGPSEGERDKLAEAFHTSGHCGYDHGTWAQIKTHGIECQCFEAADIALAALAPQGRVSGVSGEGEDKNV